MELRRRDIVALAIAAVSFALGAILWAVGRTAPGFSLGYSTDDAGRRILVVESVDPAAPVGQYLYADGVVVSLNGIPTGPGQVADQAMALGQEPSELTYVPRQELATFDPADPSTAVSVYLGEARGRLESSLLALLVGVAVLGGVLWWLGSGRGGPTLRPFTVPLAVASASPLFLLPAYLSLYPVVVVAVAALIPAALLPLAEDLADTLREPRDRRRLRLAIFGLAVAAAFAGVAGTLLDLDTGYPSLTRWVLAAAVVLLPGIAASRPLRPPTLANVGPARIVESAELAVVATLPAMSLAPLGTPGGSAFVMPLVVWLAAVLAARRFTVRPLLRLANRAALQRDLVVAATEAERTRIAADIHDDALQDLTLLVHRLDEAGDEEGAAMARTVADRLRAICGELRLPILDDLGAGPALEWLVERVGRISGGEVRLERHDETRAPADVELAVFRVAQEALSNAVRHGRPPIAVRYRCDAEWAALSVDDAGPGIESDAGEQAQGAGHFGLLGMAQRAEQIGAILDVRSWPTGGTHVGLEWRAR